MKKKIAFLLAALLTLCLSTVAFANAAEVSKEDQMAVMVKNFLDKNEYPYEYDDYTVETQFAINNTMEYANVMVYIYDDMLSVSVDAPVSGTEDICENMAIFSTLVDQRDLLRAVSRNARRGAGLYLLPVVQSGGRCGARRKRAVTICSANRCCIWRLTATASAR